MQDELPGIANGIKTAIDGSYFADSFSSAGTIADPSAIPCDYEGQLLMLWSPGIGGSSAGQEFVGGAGLNWRRDRMFGRITAFGNDPAYDCAVFARVTDGVDNCITLQNNSTAHYSAMRWVQAYADGHAERGAIGYGNSNSSYRRINYLEDFNGESGFYFVVNGHTYGGLEATTQNFIWTDGEDDVLFRVDLSGNVELSGNITCAGGAYSFNADGTFTLAAGNFTVDGLGYVYIEGTQVLQAQQPAIANATGAGDVVAQLNATLAMLRAHGLIAT